MKAMGPMGAARMIGGYPARRQRQLGHVLARLVVPSGDQGGRVRKSVADVRSHSRSHVPLFRFLECAYPPNPRFVHEARDCFQCDRTAGALLRA